MPCSPRMARCKLGCQHRALIEDYYRERDAQEVRAEAVTGGYVAESAEYFGGREQRWTFKRWLTVRARGVDFLHGLGSWAAPLAAPAFVGAPLDSPPDV